MDSQTPLFLKFISDNATLPVRGSKYAAGYDLSSAVDTIVPSRGKMLIPTDLMVKIPDGYYGRIAPRSGLALKNSIDTGAGVIDVDYRGNVMILLFNHSDEAFVVKRGAKIAQLILERIGTPPIVVLGPDEDLDSTDRGDGGFGSTDIHSHGTAPAL